MLYRIEDGSETPVENAEIQERLSELMTERLNDVPDTDTEEELSEYVKDNLEKMGYL